MKNLLLQADTQIAADSSDCLVNFLPFVKKSDSGYIVLNE